MVKKLKNIQTIFKNDLLIKWAFGVFGKYLDNGPKFHTCDKGINSYLNSILDSENENLKKNCSESWNFKS